MLLVDDTSVGNLVIRCVDRVDTELRAGSTAVLSLPNPKLFCYFLASCSASGPNAWTPNSTSSSMAVLRVVTYARFPPATTAIAAEWLPGGADRTIPIGHLRSAHVNRTISIDVQWPPWRVEIELSDVD